LPKFRKKPVVIEAEQWFPDKHVEGVLLLPSDPQMGVIHTLEDLHDTTHFVTPGDWIITGVQGEKYPCKPDIFEQTYQKVGEEYY
jgi:hypothetical protein